MKKFISFLSILFFLLSGIQAYTRTVKDTSYYLYPPACFYPSDSAVWPCFVMCPPLDSNNAVPFNFLGWNLYRDMEFIGYFPYNPIPPIYCDEGIPPGIYNYSITAVYDLSPYGYPGETGESMHVMISECVVRYGFPLPFLEPWNSGTFETNYWTADSGNWSISGQEGQPAPSANFTWDPAQQNYESALESYPFQADSLTEGNISLDFDIKLDNYQPTGTEQLLVQVWNWDSQVWTTVKDYSNAEGSFGWMAEHIDITDQAMGTVFKIRFLATGENSLNIQGWYVDNIGVYRECRKVTALTTTHEHTLYAISLNWYAPYRPEYQWIEHDDGENSGNSIGTGNEVEFDVASRWTPQQLTNYNGYELFQVGFFPAETQASYQIRIWIGDGAANLIVDQPVANPVIGQWNDILLDTPVMLDITQELWFGYHVAAQTGYPAGVDYGPAIDGYGNMINFGGWQTLLQVNPDLDYNWNIKANLHQTNIHYLVSRYAVYRADDMEDYFFKAYSDTNYYLDDSAICSTANLHCYKVLAIYEGSADTCESDWSNVACVVCQEKIKENNKNEEILIYPNPASDVLFIESAEEVESVGIYDSRGETVKQWNNGTVEQWNSGKVVGWYGGMVEIPVSGLAPGLYLVRVETGGKVIGKKVVVR